MPSVSQRQPPESLAGRVVRVVDQFTDRVFGAEHNPLRQLGALAMWMFWVVLGSGAYLYIVFDTSAAGAYSSIQDLVIHQRWWGGLIRSLHRYSSDGFALLTALHVLREWALGKYSGFRWFSWVSGVPLLWLALASGLFGYWLVADAQALYVATGLGEWAGALPGFGAGMMRNFITAEAVSDRLFSLLVFLHIGTALFVLLGLWIHLQRLVRAATQPSRQTTSSVAVTLITLCLLVPAMSDAPAEFSRIPASVPIDWFYVGVFPLMYATSPLALWLIGIGGTLLLLVLPWIGRTVRPAPAVVDLSNCNGCGRCFDDCPYGAVVMVPRADGRRHSVQAVVQSDLCASCGICVGACPSSTPFRSVQQLVTGIDLPELPLSGVRDHVQAALLRQPGATVLFGCDHGADISQVESPSRIGISLPCSGMLPPSFSEFALRHGAARVVVATCGEHACSFRLGGQWIHDRLQGLREPALRERERGPQVQLLHAQKGQEAQLHNQLINIETTPRVSASSDSHHV
ncbi:MAG: cytochrome b N-terminal domain-containing protein [Rhodoferax sp.]|nr:cytochrome b N-terminal domain-containing protein [Rhodoferax sp.]